MRKVTVLMAAVFVAMTGTAFAQTTQILHVSGNAWETGGFPPSDPGDGLNLVGILNDIEAPLVWDTANYSYTMYVRQLVALGEVDVNGTRLASYSGGLFTIYVDWLPSNHNYGTNPPNTSSPSSFSDGISTYLDGYFTGFSLSFNDVTQSGSFSGTLNFTGGDVFPLLNATTGWTFGANLAGVSPTGYDLQMNGDVYLTVVGVEDESWGGIKALYR
ncbi:MAG TPA: hypothetical protein VKU85_02465 [bacterium]|nr:hypothetical protein [bacterium]